ncbi:hypothetical protein IM543_17680 [Massilia sp. UMI-21]|nr:hypothetical protein IM543_17680 [Massilia sp. UMI-21]
MSDQAKPNLQSSTDRQGSQTGSDETAGKGEAGRAELHKSNYSAGGLPRSPGNSGPRNEDESWKPGQSMQDVSNPVHQSNDAAGGLPKSPAGANRLAGDRKMDDDTGFSRQ